MSFEIVYPLYDSKLFYVYFVDNRYIMFLDNIIYFRVMFTVTIRYFCKKKKKLLFLINVKVKNTLDYLIITHNLENIDVFIYLSISYISVTIFISPTL